jgi:CheY-like chemotaxis protein
MALKTAVIIDDEPDVTTYFETFLTDNGWSVRSANDPNEGIAMAQEDPPAVVLLDVMMPERGGLSTLIALRKDERTAKVPVVLVTGIQDRRVASHCIRTRVVGAGPVPPLSFESRFNAQGRHRCRPYRSLSRSLWGLGSIRNRSGHEDASPA